MARIFSTVMAIFVACLAVSNAANVVTNVEEELKAGMGMCSGKQMRIVKDNCQQASLEECDNAFAYNAAGNYKIKCGVVGPQCLGVGPTCDEN